MRAICWVIKLLSCYLDSVWEDGRSVACNVLAVHEGHQHRQTGTNVDVLHHQEEDLEHSHLAQPPTRTRGTSCAKNNQNIVPFYIDINIIII